MITGAPLNASDGEMLRLALYALTRKGKVVPAGWNALENDVEAFQLAVDLQIGLYFRGISLSAKFYGREDWWAEVWYNEDQYAATRRAIVAVAAMMGCHSEALPHDWWKQAAS
jgi:hypothetical protein